jgi:hypothetical protein
MSTLGQRLPIELFTSMSRITGTVVSRHIHVRDELNDSRLSLLIFGEMELATLGDLRAPRLVSADACLRKDEVLLAVPYKVKGTTSVLTQRSIQSRLGRNEVRLLLDTGPFRVAGNFYYVGSFQIEDSLWRDSGHFAALTNAEITYLPDSAISFACDELAFNTARVDMVCADFEWTEP